MNSEIPSWITDNVDIDKIPILDLGNKSGITNYIDFVTVEDVNAPIMKGIDVYKRPFLTLRIQDRLENTVSVHTIFRRYTDASSETWCTGTRYRCLIDTCIRDLDRDFLTRLFKHEPCGNNLFHGPEGLRTTSDGRSVVELY
jgi:hypothetical protein